MTLPLSGQQTVLTRGDQRAVIASVGASLREYTVAGRHLVVPFAADAVRPGFRGLTVAPWPNRIVDGRYRWQGADYQLPLTEVDRGHALHGFTPWLQFDAVTVHEHAVTLRAVIEPQPGYPWRVQLETEYALGKLGLTQTVTAVNLSRGAAPYGTCPHPYLSAGEGRVDDWTLTLPAATVLLVDDVRLIPERLAGVDADAKRFDFRRPRRIKAVELDHAFTGLERDAAGEARVTLRAEDGAGVGMVWGAECAWLQVHTADLPGAPAGEHRIGLAVEPMTCAPDAFNRGEGRGVVALQPGESHRAWWRIEPLRPAAADSAEVGNAP